MNEQANGTRTTTGHPFVSGVCSECGTAQSDAVWAEPCPNLRRKMTAEEGEALLTLVRGGWLKLELRDWDRP